MKKIIKLINLDDNNNEVNLPEAPSPFDKMMDNYPSEFAVDFRQRMAEFEVMKVPPEMLLSTLAPLPGDYLSVKDSVFRVETRFYNVSEGWIELWVREEKKQ